MQPRCKTCGRIVTLPTEPSLLWRLNWKYGWFKGKPGWFWLNLVGK